MLPRLVNTAPLPRKWIPCILCGDGPSQREVTRRDSYPIVACSGCGLRYINPQPTWEELCQFYGQSYHGSAPDKFFSLPMVPAVKKRMDDYVRLAQRHGGGGHLLDLGCGTGFFLLRCQYAGLKCEGLELSSTAAAFGRNELGLSIATGVLLDQSFPPGQFDTITMWDYLEHMLDPLAELSEASRILKPSGRLLLTVPNSGGVVARLSGSRWMGYEKVPEHVFYYTRRTLRRVLEAGGFEILSIRAQRWICELDVVLQKGMKMHAPTARLLRGLIRPFGILSSTVAFPAVNLLAVARTRP